MVERFNRTCLMMLSMFVNDRRDNWNELLPFVMHAYRTSVHESTGYSPFCLMMGEECSLPQDFSTDELRTNREHDVAPHPFATWVRDALEVRAASQVERGDRMSSQMSIGVPRGSVLIVYVNRTLYILLIYNQWPTRD